MCLRKISIFCLLQVQYNVLSVISFFLPVTNTSEKTNCVSVRIYDDRAWGVYNRCICRHMYSSSISYIVLEGSIGNSSVGKTKPALN